MKQRKLFALIIMLGLYAQEVNAGSVTDIYPSGDTLTATMMDNIKAAVNDNDSRISALSTGAVSISYKSFAVEGQLEQQVTAVVPDSSTVSHSQAFCIYDKTNGGVGNYGYFRLTSTTSNDSQSCDLTAGIQLPHGVTLSALSCSVHDNFSASTLHALSAQLRRVNLKTRAHNTIYTTSESVDSTGIQILEANAPDLIGSNIVDNTTYAYYIDVNFGPEDFSAIGDAMGLYGCVLTY